MSRQYTPCVCQHCGVAFQALSVLVKRGGGKFCGLSCSAKSRIGPKALRWSGGKVTFTCQCCGKTSQAYRTRGHPPLYCSPQCSGAMRRRPPGWCADCGCAIQRRSARCKACEAKARFDGSEMRRQFGERTKAWWAVPEHRAKMSAGAKKQAESGPPRSGPNNPNWKGGVRGQTARRIRSSKWVTFARKFRAERGDTCELCDTSPTVVHHVTPYREWPEGQYVESNLQLLCSSCHGRIDNPAKSYSPLRTSTIR